ncbi:MAG TPA: alkaline phosphatase family protein [Candidatus Binatia bacterium]|jgi:predicted AlkP superfamily phosphohydrolase/phosphomutase
MLLVVGWDGAGWNLVRRFVGEGRMPTTARLLAGGACTWNVRSTTPPVTFPAWTSFLTGANPDHHGITDFTIPRPGAYAVRFVNATHRRLPTFVASMADAGLRIGMYGMPATFPPEARGVFEICGFDTPLGSSASVRATHPESFGREIRERHGRLGIEGIPQGRIDATWHRRAALRLVDDVRLRSRIAEELMREHALDVFVVHFMEPDTVAHHFWQFDDEASPRHREGPRGVIADVYAALDEGLARLLAAAGNDADVLLLSDHGSAGGSDRVLLWNRWLADHGYLRFTGSGAAAQGLKRRALASIPSSWQARAFAAAGGLADRVESGSRFAGIDWDHTSVYSDEVAYFPSLRINLQGREPRGIVSPAVREELLARLTQDLLEMKDPFDDGCVVLSAARREALFDGPFAARLPDLVLELRKPGGYAYAAASSRAGREKTWIRRLGDDEQVGAKGSAPGGVHDQYGIALLAGPHARPHGVAACDDGDTCGLADLGVTALALAGLPATASMQGRCLVELPARGIAASVATPRTEPESDYAADEEREVESRLRALGYLP